MYARFPVTAPVLQGMRHSGFGFFFLQDFLESFFFQNFADHNGLAKVQGRVM